MQNTSMGIRMGIRIRNIGIWIRIQEISHCVSLNVSLQNIVFCNSTGFLLSRKPNEDLILGDMWQTLGDIKNVRAKFDLRETKTESSFKNKKNMNKNR